MDEFEVIVHVFTFLCPKTLMTCHRVCSTWRECAIILTTFEWLWRWHCRRDYPDVWDSARTKALPVVSWYNLYKSLTLWPKIHKTRITRKDIPINTINPDDKIVHFEIVSNEIVWIYTKKFIVYYSLVENKEIKRVPLLKSCLISNTYIPRQKPTIVAIKTEDNILHVTWMLLRIIIRYSDVKLFLLLESCLYFVTVHEEIFLCQIENGQVTKTRLTLVPDGVKLFSYRESTVYVLTSSDAIYSFADNKLKNVTRFTNKDNLMNDLIHYNFLNQKIQSSFLATEFGLDGLLYSYGSVMFTGNTKGKLSVIDSTNKTIQFTNRPHILNSYIELRNPVIHIDVVEGNESHMLIAATSNKLVTMEIDHTNE